MKLTKKQCEFILSSQFCIVATSDKSGQPRACIVMPEMAFDDKVIIADCQMGKTCENVKANPKIFLSFYDDKLDFCMKCEGVAKYINEKNSSGGGQHFVAIKNKLGAEGLQVAGIIITAVKSIYEHKENP